MTMQDKPPTSRNRWALVAPGLLCTIAALQFVLSYTISLTPWKGGGFGMFSTVDSPAARFVKIHIRKGDTDTPLPIPVRLRALANQVASAPTRDALRRLSREAAHDASQLGTGATYEHSTVRAFCDARQPTGMGSVSPIEVASLSADQITVEVWRYRVDLTASSLTAERITGFSTEIPHGEQG